MNGIIECKRLSRRVKTPYFTLAGWVAILGTALIIGTIAGVILHWQIIAPFVGG
jgi:hypothetical protein